MKAVSTILIVALLLVLFCAPKLTVQEETKSTLRETVQEELKGEKVALKTDDEAAMREERKTSLDGHSTVERKRLSGEQFGFQAEVGKLMKIISLYLYKNKEIFLRELISNASDALDKIRFASLTDPSVLDSKKELEIRIQADKDARTLVIEDSGLGMTREDLINHLGTIAQSGTQAFSAALEKGAASNLIGQFGVGFYSAYLVADRIVVQSKHNNSTKQYVWESSDQNTFAVYEDPAGDNLGRGTRITLHLKSDPDIDEFMDPTKLNEIILRYSQFISFPIHLYSSHEEERPAPIEESEETTEPAAEDSSEEEEDSEQEPAAPKTVKETVWDWEKVNTVKPIWLRSKRDITEEEYNDFYKSISKDTQNPVTFSHFDAEGDVEFKAILFLPKDPPYAQFDPSIRHKGVKLYVRRVFITDDFDAVLPKYLSFIKGVVDSDSLPLNIAREQLQEEKALKTIKTKLIRKAVGMFQSLATSNVTQYNTFWDGYGTNIKLGVIEDIGNRARLSELLRFESTKVNNRLRGKDAEKTFTSFDDYVKRMKKNQDEIYFLSGSSVEELQKSPLLEKLVRKGYEVLLMVDPIDEYVMQHLNKYDSKYKLTNLGKEGVKITDSKSDKNKDKASDKEEKLNEARTENVRKYLSENFGDVISRVKVSDRLVSSPAVLVADTWGMTSSMERVAKSQTLGDKRAGSMEMWAGKKVLEINAGHKLITKLEEMVKSGKDMEEVRRVASLVVDTAALTGGYQLRDPSGFAKNIVGNLMSGLGLENVEEGEDVAEEENNSGDAEEASDEHDEL
eukprot:TRINITY_DN25493_c0_g1_i1.p1 TRINITY_DN25493_c0_g1~~TRINITY_DN25493_c0_g1_i1.p1  ORF type:complete len:794 (-),score=257.32 TRINITY_DN25493_c0_g1_i1:52-2433(-)